MALLAGMTGAKYLTNEVDKRLLQAAVANAAAAKRSAKESEMIENSSPMQAFRVSKNMINGDEGRFSHPQGN